MKAAQGLVVAGAIVLLFSPQYGLGKDPKLNRARENADFGFDELSKKLTLMFTDAVTGKPIEGAAVTLQNKVSRTDAKGKASFPYPRLGREEGYLDLLFEKPGYIRTTIKLHFLLDSVWINRYSISPALPAGRYRIALDWGTKPPDLDSHLIKEGKYHISFRDMRKFEDQAWLDRDDMDGEGPETITIAALDPNASYTYFVHDYTDRNNPGFSELNKSRAHVMVWNDAGLVQSFEVPAGPGRVWEVFEIKGGQIAPLNRVVSQR